MDKSSSFHAGITATIRLDVVLSVATGLSKGRKKEKERTSEGEGGRIRRIERRIYKANRPSDGFSESELCGGRCH